MLKSSAVGVPSNVEDQASPAISVVPPSDEDFDLILKVYFVPFVNPCIVRVRSAPLPEEIDATVHVFPELLLCCTI